MVKLRTLGECVIEVGENRIGPDSKVVFALLLYLGLQRGKRVARATLIDLLWPESSPDKAAHSLRQTIYQCRKLGAAIESTRAEVTLSLDESHWDASEIESIEDVSAVARGFLPGYHDNLSEAFAQWVEEQRCAILAKTRWRMLVQIGHHTARGHWEDAYLVARELVRIDPLNEEASLVMAEATAMRGNKAAAIRMLDDFSIELGADTRLQVPATLLRRRIVEQIPDDKSTSNPFIGRDEALAFLNQHMEGARKSEGRTALVWGDAGIGKSRLISEFENAVRLHGMQVVKIECHPTDAEKPYSVFMEAIPRLVQLRGSIGCAPHTLELLKRFTNHGEAQLLTSDPGPATTDLSPQFRRAIVDLLGAVSSDRPLVFVIEDIHWLDDASREIVTTLHRHGADLKLFTLLTSRVNHGPAHQELGHGIAAFALRPLSDIDSRALFEDLLQESHNGLDNDAFGWFTAVAEGNPYYLRELARHYLHTGRSHSVPASLQALLAERLHRVSDGALRFLQVCSLLGRHSTFDRVDRSLQVHTFELLSALEELERMDLVATQAQHIVSKHALLADQAISMCTPATLRLFHRRIAQALEVEVIESRSTALLWTCADHWRQADDTNRASRLAKACASHLVSLGLVSDAISILEDVAAYVDNTEERCDLLRSLGIAHAGKRNWTKASETLELLKKLKSSTHMSCGHDPDELRLLEARGCAAMGGHDRADILEHLGQFLRCSKASDASAIHRLDAAVLGVRAADNVVQPAMVDALFSSVQDLIHHETQPLHQRLWVQLVYETTRGDLAKGIDLARGLVDFHRRANNVLELIRALAAYSVPLRLAGHFSQARACSSEVAALAGERELWTSYISALDVWATTAVIEGNLAEAHDILDRALEKSDAHHVEGDSFRTSLQLVRTQAFFAEGNYERAIVSHQPSALELERTFDRHRIDSLAMSFLAAEHTGAPINESHLQDLSECHRRGASTGRHEWATAGLATALRQRGRKDEAIRLVRHYLQGQRRERYSLRPYFRKLLREEVLT